MCYIYIWTLYHDALYPQTVSQVALIRDSISATGNLIQKLVPGSGAVAVVINWTMWSTGVCNWFKEGIWRSLKHWVRNTLRIQ